MENKQEKSAAELYREERKQRMAKAAKKNATKSPQLSKLGRNVGKALGIIIIIALCLGVIYACLSFFGVPQKTLTAMKVGNQKVSVAKYNYYYMDNYLNIYNTASQYEQYYGAGSGKTYTGYDISAAPADQAYTGEIEGVENPTWADALDYSAKNSVHSYVAYAQLAKQAGVTLTDEQKAEIDEGIETIKSHADEADYSLNRFIARYYGKGCDEKLLREILEERYLAGNFAQAKQDEISKSVTDEQIQEEFEKNKASYTTFDMATFTVDAVYETAEGASDEEVAAAKAAAMETAKAQADAYLARITDAASVVKVAQEYKATNKESSIILNDTTTSSLADEAASWVLSADRKVGDKGVFEDENGYVIVLLTSLPAPDRTKGVDVRHILVKFSQETDDNGNAVELTDEQKQTYYAKAQDLYNKYLENPTEENFAQLATENTEDTGSKETGGLYEAVYPGDMVTEFNDWIFDEARKPGDTGIIETTYGYHIMYYVNNDNPEKWYDECKDAIASAAVDSFNTSVIEGDEYALVTKDSVISWAKKTLEKTVATQQANISANSK